MIAPLLRAWWTSLARDRVAQSMILILPVAFFSIFALIFGGQGRDSTPRIRVAVVDEDRSPASGRMVAALRAERGLDVRAGTRSKGAAKNAPEIPFDRAAAMAWVRDGEGPVAVVLPAGLDTSLARFDGRGVPVELFADPSDPIAPQMVGGLLQKVAMTAAPDHFARRGLEQFERFGGAFTPQQRRAAEMLDRRLDQIGAARTAPGADTSTFGPAGGVVRVSTTNLLGSPKDNGMVAFYAAGIAVMFLLFSCAAAGGSLLEESESGTLDRILGSKVGMTGLLTGKWLYLTLMGILQITVMFLWAMLVFRLDLLSHIAGFAVMTAATAATAAAFGLVLATACRSRAQLSSISTIVILCLSALGGSMFPRFLMSETMQKIGLVGFNAWALDGYIKVFWRDAAVVELAPQVGVILAFGAAFLLTARLLARKWEAV